MATPQYATEQLIENIKRRCSVPTSQLTFTDNDFALMANDELQGEVAPLIMSTREEYFVDYVDVAAPADGIIPFPEETIGNKIRSVCYVQAGSPLNLINLPRINLDVVAGVGFSNYNTLAGFYLQGNDLVLYPNTSVPTNTTIRIYYYKRTLVLASPSQYGRVISVDPNTNTVVLSFVPPEWVVGDKLNSVGSKPPFAVTNASVEITTLSAPSVILDSVEGIEVGDYISELGYSAIPQVPIEAHSYLAQLTAAKCLESLGDTQGMQSALAKADKLKTALMVMISQRVDGSAKKIVNPNGGMRLSSGLGRWGRRRGGF
jgi:hypothetical protein